MLCENLSTGEGIEELSKAHATVEGLPTRWQEIIKMTRTALDSQIVQEAISTDKYYKEMYVGASSGQTVIEGFVDLLFETEDGSISATAANSVLDFSEKNPFGDVGG